MTRFDVYLPLCVVVETEDPEPDVARIDDLRIVDMHVDFDGAPWLYVDYGHWSIVWGDRNYNLPLHNGGEGFDPDDLPTNANDYREWEDDPNDWIYNEPVMLATLDEVQARLRTTKENP